MRAELAAERQRREAAEEACAASIAQVCIADSCGPHSAACTLDCGTAGDCFCCGIPHVCVSRRYILQESSARVCEGQLRPQQVPAHVSTFAAVVYHTSYNATPRRIVRIDCIHRQSARRCIGGTQISPQYTGALPGTSIRYVSAAWLQRLKSTAVPDGTRVQGERRAAECSELRTALESAQAALADLTK